MEEAVQCQSLLSLSTYFSGTYHCEKALIATHCRKGENKMAEAEAPARLRQHRLAKEKEPSILCLYSALPLRMLVLRNGGISRTNSMALLSAPLQRAAQLTV